MRKFLFINNNGDNLGTLYGSNDAAFEQAYCLEQDRNEEIIVKDADTGEIVYDAWC